MLQVCLVLPSLRHRFLPRASRARVAARLSGSVPIRRNPIRRNANPNPNPKP